MRLLAVILIALVGLIQYPLWLGKGGWYRVWSLQGQVAEQREINEGLRARNAALAAEVQDLQSGTGALEERARGDLGMIREGEVFVQILPPDTKPPSGEHGMTVPPRAGAKPAAASSAPRSAGSTTARPASSTGARPAAAQDARSASSPNARTGSASSTGTAATPNPRPSNATPAARSGAGTSGTSTPGR